MKIACDQPSADAAVKPTSGACNKHTHSEEVSSDVVGQLNTFENPPVLTTLYLLHFPRALYVAFIVYLSLASSVFLYVIVDSEIPDNISFTSAKKTDIKLIKRQGFEYRKVRSTLYRFAVTNDETSAKN